MLVAAVALMAVASAPDPTPTPARLAPAGKWVVDGELTECILARRFGTGDQQIILGFVPGDSADHLAIRVRLPQPIHITYGQPATVTVFPSGASVEGSVGNGRIGTSVKSDQFAVGLDGAFLHDAESITGLAIALDGQTILSVTPTDLHAALTVVDACEDQLLDRWGIDATERAAVAKPPRPISEFPYGDYPQGARRDNAEGETIARLRVMTDGHVDECQVVSSSGTRALDDETCRDLRRMRYQPALDANGKPIEALFIERVDWRLIP